MKRPRSIFELSQVRKLLVHLATANYSDRQMGQLVRRWRRDLAAVEQRAKDRRRTPVRTLRRYYGRLP